MKIMRATSVNENVQEEISAVFVDGFYQWLKYFSKNKNKLIKAFAHMFNLNLFYIVLENNQIAAIASCANNQEKSAALNKQILKKYLDFFRGNIAYIVLKNFFEEKIYPFEMTKDTGIIEFVATSLDYRKKGFATALVKQILLENKYKEYVLEVADTNINAVNLYQKLGFTEFLRVKEKHSRKSGINYLLYMKLINN